MRRFLALGDTPSRFTSHLPIDLARQARCASTSPLPLLSNPGVRACPRIAARRCNPNATANLLCASEAAVASRAWSRHRRDGPRVSVGRRTSHSGRSLGQSLPTWPSGRARPRRGARTWRILAACSGQRAEDAPFLRPDGANSFATAMRQPSRYSIGGRPTAPVKRSKNAERESAAVFASSATVHERVSWECICRIAGASRASAKPRSSPGGAPSPGVDRSASMSSTSARRVSARSRPALRSPDSSATRSRARSPSAPLAAVARHAVEVEVRGLILPSAPPVAAAAWLATPRIGHTADCRFAVHAGRERSRPSPTDASALVALAPQRPRGGLRPR